MGIRFRCHQCGHELHVKDFQAGKRSRCPACEIKFRIPNESAELSIPLPQENARENDSAANAVAGSSASHLASGTLASKAGANKSATSKSVTSKSTSGKTTSYAGDSESHREGDVQRDDPEELQLAESEADASKPSQSGQPASPLLSEAAQKSQPTTEPLAPPAMNAQPQAIVEAPGANWYVRPPAGGQYGPAPANIFCEWLTENRVTRDSLVWRDGWPQWLVASDVFPDYFGPAIPQQITAGPVATPVAAPEQAAAPEFVAPVSLSDRALAARKRQRKKNYMIMIAVLATISIGLVVALVVVLMKNS